MVLALSSTAIVLQTLNEKSLMGSEGGRASFSVLLFQDIAVIPMLAFLPLLALPELAAITHGAEGGGHGGGFVEHLPAWQRGLVTVAAIVAVVVGGSLLSRPLFRFIAVARLQELFTAVALAIVVGIALLMTLVGLSPALGTFLAGVVLANSEYRHQLEADLDPFKGLLLGLFFITVGAAINFQLLFSELGLILLLTLGLILVKALVLWGLALLFRIRGLDRWLFALGLAQAGEFGFVLLAMAVSQGVLPPALSERLLLVVALSMLITPILFILYDRVIAPRYADAQSREPDEIDETGKVIIAGVGRFGGIINQILLAAGNKTVVLDHHSEHLDRLRVFGVKVFFGDATRPDLLHAAGIGDARLLVVALDDREQATRLVRHVAQEHPDVHIVARAIDRHHVYELFQAGCSDIIRETFDGAVRAARSALEALGVHPYDAERQTRGFVENDRRAMRELAEVYDPDVPFYENEPYVERTKVFMANVEDAMRGSSAIFGTRNERGWVPPSQDDVKTVEQENENGRD
jgi:CPA2 family monovalent cation:H+ antiporter-2